MVIEEVPRVQHSAWGVRQAVIVVRDSQGYKYDLGV